MQLHSYFLLSTITCISLYSRVRISPCFFNEVIISSKSDFSFNGKDILNHTNKNSGPWLKDTLREIEIAVISNQIVNTKEEILEWVDAHVKI